MDKNEISLTLLFIIGLGMVSTVSGASILIDNASFEDPAIDLELNPFGVDVSATGWAEIDLDAEFGTHIGVFVNTAEGEEDHFSNSDGNQLAYMTAISGEALEQELEATYKALGLYQLTAAVGVSYRTPPDPADPTYTLELALFYLRGQDDSVDIVSRTISANGLSSTRLQDFSVVLPVGQPGDPWIGKPIGVAIRATGSEVGQGGAWVLDNVRLDEQTPTSIPIDNASFEDPAIDLELNPFGVDVSAKGWTEIDLDAEFGTHIGVFVNTAEGEEDHFSNSDGNQLAYMTAISGEALEQELEATYKALGLYQLTAAVGVSYRTPPDPADPTYTLELALFYLRGQDDTVDIVSRSISANGLSSTHLQDFSVVLPVGQPGDPWIGKPIGVAIRATGSEVGQGGAWVLDNVRLDERR